jgi:hypothetical protein
MRQTDPRSRPPHLVAWLVELFASTNQSESILGDVHEEFLDIYSESGVVAARRWYRRQGVKSIAHLAGAAFRDAPWSFAAFVLLGFLLRWFGAELPARAIDAILGAQRPYSNEHYDFYVWLVTWGTPIARVIEMTLIGCIIAAIARGKEIVVTTTVIAISVVIVGWNFFLHTRNLPPQVPIPWGYLLASLANWVATLLGAIIIREVRSLSLRLHSTP